MSNVSSQCIVRAIVMGFHDTVTDDYSDQLLESSENVLTDAIQLQV